MSNSSPWSQSALPAVLSALQATASAGPVDTSVVIDAGAALFSLPGLALIEITGRDRIRFLHAMLSNDVSAMDRAGEGHGLRASLNDLKGRLVADVHLYATDPEKKTGAILALLEDESEALLVGTLDKYVIAEKVYFERTGQAVFAVVGPRASAALASAGASLPGPEPHAHCVATLGGAQVRLARHELGGGDDLLLFAEPGDVDAARAALSGIPTPGPEVLEALRIEAALPRPGGDVTNMHIVLEGGLKERSVSFTKGCYIGQEVICRIDSMGTPARLLVQMEGGDVAPAPGTELFANGKAVGYVTSSVFSTRRGGPVFLGYVKKKANAVGGTIQLGAPDGPVITIRAHV